MYSCLVVHASFYIEIAQVVLLESAVCKNIAFVTKYAVNCHVMNSIQTILVMFAHSYTLFSYYVDQETFMVTFDFMFKLVLSILTLFAMFFI